MKENLPKKSKKPSIVFVEREFSSVITSEELLIHIIRAYMMHLYTIPP